MNGTEKLRLFYDKYPMTVIWFPFSILGIFLGAFQFQDGNMTVGVVLILMQIPWLWSVFAKYDEFMKGLDT